MLTKSIIAILSTAALLHSTAAVSSDAESLEELRGWQSIVESRGYTCRDKVQGRYLAEGKSYTVNTTLYEENSYVLIAGGNTHTRDLDIELYDENRNLLSKDEKTDKIPMVGVSPKWDGEFHAKVTMYEGKGYSNLMVCWKKD